MCLRCYHTMEDNVSVAIRKCPFLAKVAAQNGTEYARGVALAPTQTVQQHSLQPVGLDAEQQYEASFQLFHGAHGIVPLVVKPKSSNAQAAASRCPFHAAHQRGPSPGLQPSSSKPPQAQPRTLPLATISLSFGSGPNVGDLLRKQLQKHQGSGSKRQPSNRAQHPQQPQQHLGSSSSASQGTGGACSASGCSNTGSTGPGGFKPQRPLTDPCVGSTSSGGAPRASGIGPGHGPHPAAAAGPSAAGPAAPQLGPGTQLSSNGMHGAAGGAGAGATASRGGWPALGSGSSAGFSAFSSSAAGPAPSPFRASASSTASSTTNGGATNSGVRGPGISQGKQGGVGNSSSSSVGGGSSGGPPGGPSRNPRGSRTGAGSARQAGPVSKGGSTGRVAGSTAGSAGAAATPSCPLRKWLGPVAGLVFNEYDKLVCPPPIVAARAALSRTAAVQSLRPQQLPVKLVAVAAVAAASNMPCGAVREHFEKFSLGWFIAVHATIPFVAMLRKAVIMPKYAMVITFAAAVIGQVIGSRLERARLAQLQQQGLQDPLTAWMMPQQSFTSAAAAATAGTGAARGAAAADVASSAGNGSGSVPRGAGWRAKLLAGARAGLAGDQEVAAAAASGSGTCGSEAGSRAVVGLGSWLPQLPVVKA